MRLGPFRPITIAALSEVFLHFSELLQAAMRDAKKTKSIAKRKPRHFEYSDKSIIPQFSFTSLSLMSLKCYAAKKKDYATKIIEYYIIRTIDEWSLLYLRS